MPDLTSHYLSVALDTGDRRCKLLNQPLLHRAHIQYQDWQLAGSLYALLQRSHMPPAPEEKPEAAFAHTWLLLQQQGQQALEELACRFDAAEGQKTDYRPAIAAALRCSALDITDTEQLTNISPAFLTCLAQQARSLPEALLQNWITSGEDALQAAALTRLATDRPGKMDWLEPWFDATDHPDTRLSALFLAASGQHPAAIQQLANLDDADLHRNPAITLLAAWLHPDIYFHRGLQAAALTGRPDCIPALLDALHQPEQARTAEQAWLWLTGQRLPHSAPVQDPDAAKRHVAPGRATLPDAELTQRWCQKNHWDQNQRYFLGKPVTVANLQQQVRQYCGQAAPLLHAHLGYHTAQILVEPYGLWLAPAGVMQ